MSTDTVTIWKMEVLIEDNLSLTYRHFFPGDHVQSFFTFLVLQFSLSYRSIFFSFGMRSKRKSVNFFCIITMDFGNQAINLFQADTIIIRKWQINCIFQKQWIMFFNISIIRKWNTLNFWKFKKNTAELEMIRKSNNSNCWNSITK